MSAVVLVDWLGRGGIAHCTAAWNVELRRHGVNVSIITRAGRELRGPGVHTVTGRGRVRAHLAVVRRAAAIIADERPGTVIVQNWVMPALERPLYDAARRAGTRVVVVVHDHRMHAALAGVRYGLRGLLRRADAVVAHTDFVRSAVERYVGRSAQVLPLPVPVTALNQRRPADAVLPVDGLLGVHFGILKRSYKGTDIVAGLAEKPPPGWEFAVIGTGAPPARDHLISIDRFLDAGELCALVTQSAATLLPYRFATQSAAVVLAQACGSVVVATGVGGIPEQIVDGETGRLVPPAAGPPVWRAVLGELSDDAERRRIASSAERAVWAAHRRFVDAAVAVTR